MTVPDDPTGSFATPDVEINEGFEAAVVLQGLHIPIGTTIKLHIISEDAGEQILEGILEQDADGLDETTTSTISLYFPSGFSKSYIHATWEWPP